MLHIDFDNVMPEYEPGYLDAVVKAAEAETAQPTKVKLYISYRAGEDYTDMHKAVVEEGEVEAYVKDFGEDLIGYWIQK